MTDNKKENIFEYLNLLKESGLINMFEAPQYLKQEYNITFKKACEYFEEWTWENFKKKGDN